MQRIIAFALTALLCLAACGPIQVASAVGDAEDAIELAQQADAQINARYEYWMAVLYLDKAKRIDGRAEYQAASEMANEAMAFAKAAVEQAEKEKMRQQVLQQRLKARDALERP
ncbi:MAG: hypothetical protein ACPGU1_13970 [Myxococcota bacterium]